MRYTVKVQTIKAIIRLATLPSTATSTWTIPFLTSNLVIKKPSMESDCMMIWSKK